ncbi:MAG: DUF2063 domain-containing protein [Gammaproteobacteria bacterium]|nr:DUF2063 domain-containing protein [Gammaproteobacteria bacterium]
MAVDFRAKQDEFTRYIRDPDNQPLPADVKPERMAMYRELIYNNLESFLAGNFPVIRQILSDDQWHVLVQDFILKHQARTPYFAEIAEEFLNYLENERNNPDDFPFLLELAHYEWVELALSVAVADANASAEKPEITDASLIGLSPVAWLLLYSYPVHLISPDYLPAEPPQQPATLVAYRDDNDAVKFMEINAFTYRLLEIIQEQGNANALTCVQQIAQEANHPNPETIIANGLKTLQQLADKGIVRAG